MNNCSGKGQCIEADLCICDMGYTGPDCSNASCEGVNYCSGKDICSNSLNFVKKSWRGFKWSRGYERLYERLVTRRVVKKNKGKGCVRTK